MIRICALNEETDDESESEKEEVTREALEEIALQQYAKILEMQRKGESKHALKLLKDLLDTDLLYGIENQEKDKVSRPLFNLKYLCHRNIASLSSQFGDNDAAIEAYLSASELDSSDVTLWFRLGKISLQCEKFELASYAFQRGVDCNPKHWPCIDNLITVLLGLGNYNDCIANIYNALELDSDYYRGRAYRKHIFTDYPYILEYLRLLNPIYKWESKEDEYIVGAEYDKLLKEAYEINDSYIEQINKNKVVERLPVLTLNKPIEKLTWLSLGESLTDMHLHITKNALSHACVVEISQPEIKNVEVEVEKMDVDFSEIKSIIEPVVDNPTVEEKSDVEKVEDPKTESEKDPETEQEANKSSNDGKDSKKPLTRRRGSSLSFLEQWEWCTKRRSSRKKPVNRQDRNDENIYDTLKSLLPPKLLSEEMLQKKSKEFNADESLDTMDIYKLFEEKEKKVADTSNTNETTPYFGSEEESSDVDKFITKYVNSKCDIITMVDEYVFILSKFWKLTWPDKLGDVYSTANKCSRQHYDPPYHNVDDKINNFVTINMMQLEVDIGRLLKNSNEQKENVDIELLDVLKILCPKYEASSDEFLKVILRYLWVKCHAHLHENKTEFAIDCLYQMLYEFNNQDDEDYTLHVPNFINKSIISKSNTIELLKSLERNKQLSTVLHLYEIGKYEEILPILQDSFKQCQIQANKQEWSEMGLDWAVHLVIIIEILWALENSEQCFTWSVICLHEALKQYFQCTTGTLDFDKWTLTVTKILLTIEHILKIEGSSYLDIIPEKGLAHFVQDIVQIIVHQMDDMNSSDDMPLKTAVPWILLHYILQREEDCGRSPKKLDDDSTDDIPPSLMILFTGHNYLGKKNWCSIEDRSLLYFTLNTVIPRLRSPALSNVVETISQHMEQVVYCLFGHPSKKNKIRYLYDHNASPIELDWAYAQQIFELYRPFEMPEFNSYRLGSITSDIEQLFHKILKLLPTECDPASHANDVINFIENRKDQLPNPGIIFPYKIRDIYYLLADYYLKNNETVKALKYYAFDIVITSNRFDSWAGIALARASLLETKLNSCETFKTEMEYLNRAAAVEKCFKKALEIDSSHSILWIEYGAFVYGVHSFCSRMLKQASESLSMENFEVLEKRKEDMLNTAHKCFISAHKEWLKEYESEDKALQDERWLHYYMLGKIAEKRGELPSIYLKHYIKAGQHLLENNAMYPSKINYNNPQNLSVEALEIHYRIHASILKYIVHHEDKKILSSIGKAFKECLAQCATGPFSKKKQPKEQVSEKNQTTETPEKNQATEVSEKIPTTDTVEKIQTIEVLEKNPTTEVTEKPQTIEVSETIEPQQSGVKRPMEDQITEEASKKPKLLESDSPSDDTDKLDKTSDNSVFDQKELVPGDMMETACEVEIPLEKESNDANDNMEPTNEIIEPVDETEKSETRRISQESNTTSKEDSSSSSSSSSSSEDSSSDTSSDSSNDSAKPEKEDAEMSYEDVCDIISICLDNLEECVSRFPQHYKALYRLTHYHFYYKKDKNVERCRDMMMGSFLGRNNTRMQGLFTERKNSNFFSGIWRIPASEVDRPGSFASHMSRCVLITMEILKEVDDHKVLLDLSLQLQRTPEAEKKYLRDSERSELSQQALSLCTRSIKGIYTKYHQTANLANHTEKKNVSMFMLDVYKSYQKVQKHIPAKNQMFSAHLIDCFKFLSGGNVNESANLLESSIKYCQSLITMMKQQSNVVVSSSSQSNSTPTVTQSKKTSKVTVEPTVKPVTTTASNSFLPTMDLKQSFAKSVYGQSLSSSYMQYQPLMDAISYIANRDNPINNYASDYFQQLLTTNLANSFMQQLSNANFSISKTKTTDTKTSKTSQNPGLKRQHSTPTTASASKPKLMSQKSTGYMPSFSTPLPKKTPPVDASKYSTAAISNSILASTAISNLLNSSQTKPPKKTSSADTNKYSAATISNSMMSNLPTSSMFNIGSTSFQAKMPKKTAPIDSVKYSTAAISNSLLANASSANIFNIGGTSIQAKLPKKTPPTDNAKYPISSNLTNTSSSNLFNVGGANLLAKLPKKTPPMDNSKYQTAAPSNLTHTPTSNMYNVGSSHISKLPKKSSPMDNAKYASTISSHLSSMSNSNVFNVGGTTVISKNHKKSSPIDNSKYSTTVSSNLTNTSNVYNIGGAGLLPKIPKKSSPMDNNKYSSSALSSSSMTSTSSNMFNIGNTSFQAKPAHQPAAHGVSTSSGMAKPAHMSTTSTVNAALHTKPPMPHQQVSPGKTLQEKLAERQKQNPNNPKLESISPRPMDVFSGKLPASLTITKSSRSGADTPSDDGAMKKSGEAKKSIRFENNDKIGKPKTVDTSEIIILDDD